MWNPKWLWKNERIDERENKPTYAREKSSDSRNRQLENRDDRNQRKNDDSQYYDKINRYKNENHSSRQFNDERGRYSRNRSSSTTITETEEVQATLEIHTQEITTPGITPETIILEMAQGTDTTTTLGMAQATNILQIEVAQGTEILH